MLPRSVPKTERKTYLADFLARFATFFSLAVLAGNFLVCFFVFCVLAIFSVVEDSLWGTAKLNISLARVHRECAIHLTTTRIIQRTENCQRRKSSERKISGRARDLKTSFGDFSSGKSVRSAFPITVFKMHFFSKFAQNARKISENSVVNAKFASKKVSSKSGIISSPVLRRWFRAESILRSMLS